MRLLERVSECFVVVGESGYVVNVLTVDFKLDFQFVSTASMLKEHHLKLEDCEGVCEVCMYCLWRFVFI